MFIFNLHHITLILNGYLSNISCSPLPFGLLSSQVNGNGITFSHVELSFRRAHNDKCSTFIKSLISSHFNANLALSVTNCGNYKTNKQTKTRREELNLYASVNSTENNSTPY